MDKKEIQTYFKVNNLETKKIIFFHDFFCGPEIFLEQFEFFQNSYDCLVVELRFQDTIANSLKELIKHLDDKHLLLVGSGYGGSVALEFVRLFPHRVERMALINANPYPEHWDKKNYYQQLAQHLESSLCLEDVLLQLVPYHIVSPVSEEPEELYQRLEQAYFKNDPLTLAKALENMAQRDDFTDFLKDIDIPVLILRGESDRMTSLNVQVEMQRRIAKSQFFSISQSAHFPSLEAAPETNSLLKTFFEGYERSV